MNLTGSLDVLFLIMFYQQFFFSFNFVILNFLFIFNFFSLPYHLIALYVDLRLPGLCFYRITEYKCTEYTSVQVTGSLPYVYFLGLFLGSFSPPPSFALSHYFIF